MDSLEHTSTHGSSSGAIDPADGVVRSVLEARNGGAGTTEERIAAAGGAHFYHYNCSGECDEGWGCCYRACQSMLHGAKGSVLSIKNIQKLLASAPEAASRGWSQDSVGSTKWMEPPDVAIVLRLRGLPPGTEMLEWDAKLPAANDPMGKRAAGQLSSALETVSSNLWQVLWSDEKEKSGRPVDAKESGVVAPAVIDDGTFAYTVAAIRERPPSAGPSPRCRGSPLQALAGMLPAGGIGRTRWGPDLHALALAVGKEDPDPELAKRLDRLGRTEILVLDTHYTKRVDAGAFDPPESRAGPGLESAAGPMGGAAASDLKGDCGSASKAITSGVDPSVAHWEQITPEIEGGRSGAVAATGEAAAGGASGGTPVVEAEVGEGKSTGEEAEEAPGTPAPKANVSILGQQGVSWVSLPAFLSRSRSSRWMGAGLRRTAAGAGASS